MFGKTDKNLLWGRFRDVKFNLGNRPISCAFPAGVLEQSPPKFTCWSTKTKMTASCVRCTSQIVRSFLYFALFKPWGDWETLEEILGKIILYSVVWHFSALLPGICVLISSLIIQANTNGCERLFLARGAVRKAQRLVTKIQYGWSMFFLGSFSSMSGLFILFGRLGLLSEFVFNTKFRGAWLEGLNAITFNYLFWTIVSGLAQWAERSSDHLQWRILRGSVRKFESKNRKL